MRLRAFNSWLQAQEKSGDFIKLSDARAYQHSEDEYDEYYDVDPESYMHGEGLIDLLRAAGADFTGPALELACGTGHLSVGLVRDSPYPSVILTDVSSRFLEITRRKLNTIKVKARGPVHYAILLDEDMGKFPPASLSLVVLRSALHHFIDVPRFIGLASRALKRGGVLAFEEPCEEGFLILGLLGDMLTRPEVHQGKLSTEQLRQIKLFADTIKFYVRRDLDKTLAEDKHLFRPDELMMRGAEVGLNCKVYPNRSFCTYAKSNPEPSSPDLGKFFLNYLKHCMGFGPELTEAIAPMVKPSLDYLAEASANNPRHMMALGIFKKKMNNAARFRKFLQRF